MNQTVTLNNGINMPIIGFGTGSLKDQKAYESVLYALEIGYRHIDTAAIYLNESQVGQAIVDSNIARSEIFITSKIPVNEKTYQGVLNAFDQSTKKLKTTYLDLYLIHAPWSWDFPESDHQKENSEVYRALEKLYKEGKIRAIGVSNFLPRHIDHLLETHTIKPQINQINSLLGFHKMIQWTTVKNTKLL